MSFIKKKTDLIFILNIYVKPNSHQQDISDDGDLLLISLKSKPEKNRANKELVKLLQKKLNLSLDQIHFTSGLKTQYKTIQINFKNKLDKENLYNMLFEK